MARLNPRQRRFIEEYLLDLNATQAAIRAGYSPKTAYSIGSENLKKPEILAGLEARRKALAASLEVTPERIIREYARIGFADMRRYSTWGPGGVRLTDSAALTDDEAAAVAEVSETTTDAGGSVRFKLHDKKGALDSLSRHLGLFTDKVEHSGAVRVVRLPAKVPDRDAWGAQYRPTPAPSPPESPA